MFRDKFRKNLLIISLAALLLRIWAVFSAAAANNGINSMMTPSPLSDLYTYWDLSGEILSGTFSGEFYYQPFYYAVFLPAVRFIFPDTQLAAALVQAFLGAAAVFFTGLCARYIFSRRAGIWTALLMAFSNALILYTPYLQNETLQIFNLTLLLCMTLTSAYSGKYLWRTILAGLVCGAAILTRGNAWLLLPVVMLYAGIAGKSILRPCIILISALLLTTPFAWHNSKLRGSFTGPSTAAGQVLALGNTPEAPPGGREFGLPAGAMEYPASYHAFIHRQDKEGVAVWRSMAEWALEEPAAFLELQWRKILLTFDRREIPNNVSMAVEGEQITVLKFLFFGTSGVIITLGLAGVMLSLKRRDRRTLLLHGFSLIIFMMIIIFYILSRFRAVLLPFLAIYGGWALEKIQILLEERPRLRHYLPAAAALSIGTFISFSAYDIYRYGFETEVMRFVRPHGVKQTLPSGEVMMLDNGPLSFGSWTPLTLERDLCIVKEWGSDNENKTESDTFDLAFLAGTPGSVTFLANGTYRHFECAGAGLHRFSFTAPGGRLHLQIKCVTGEIMLLTDAQRNYRRTRTSPSAGEEPKPLQGELVAKRLVNPEK